MKLITSKWCKTYTVNYKHVMDNLTVTDDKDLQNQVNELIREDLASDLLNKIGAKASWLMVDKGQSLGEGKGEEENTGLYLNNNLLHVAL